MISLVYDGKVSYITKIEDFRDFIDSSVYEALVEALDTGIVENYREKYEALKNDYYELESEYEELLDVENELRDCESELDDMTEKYETLKKALKVLVNNSYQGYIKQEDIIYELEKLVD